MRKLQLIFFTLFLAVSGLLPAQTVVDVIVNSTAHDTLEAAVIAAELDDDLAGPGPFTVFAPTDAAFAALPDGTLSTLLDTANQADLIALLTYHVVGDSARSGDLSNGQVLPSLQGSNLLITTTEDGVFVNGVEVTMADIAATNGVVHVIDVVLSLPPATVVDIVVASEAHDTLEAAVIAAGLADDLSGAGPFTVFAPTDDAFAALPAGTVGNLLADSATLANILLYHVVGAEAFSAGLSSGDQFTTLEGSDVRVVINDDGVFINDAQVTVTDIIAQNGVVHVIDAVLTPPPATVVDIIVASEAHDTLEAAVLAVGLETALSGVGPFTVFAPTDAAFAALPVGTVANLLADSATLTNILLYHAVGAAAYSDELNSGDQFMTLEGSNVR
ncbi:MAG: fasciclin domain-containing protein, partial [Bacteroidota bacterium]